MFMWGQYGHTMIHSWNYPIIYERWWHGCQHIHWQLSCYHSSIRGEKHIVSNPAAMYSKLCKFLETIVWNLIVHIFRRTHIFLRKNSRRRYTELCCISPRLCPDTNKFEIRNVNNFVKSNKTEEILKTRN